MYNRIVGREVQNEDEAVFQTFDYVSNRKYHSFKLGLS